MRKHSHIFFSYAFDRNGQAHRLKIEEVAKELKDEGLSWVHLDGNNDQSKKWLEREVSYLDHLIIDALFAEETRPRIIEFDSGMLVILRGINLNADAELENMVSIRLWVDDSRIISIQKRNFSAAFNIAKKLEDGKKIKNAGEFLYNFIYENLVLISPTISNLNNKIDSLEEKLIKNYSKVNGEAREAVSFIRKQAAIFKRYLMPQRDVLLQLKSSDNEWISDWARRHFQENHDQISHIIEELEETKERAQIVHDELSNALTDKLNKNIFKISLLTSIFMPLGFVTGLFGMNVGGIPGSHSQEGFYMIVSIMCITISLALMVFRRKKFL